MIRSDSGIDQRDCKTSPRFGTSEDDYLYSRKCDDSPTESTFAQIANQIGALSKPVDSTFWLRGIRKRYGNSESLSEEGISCPSTPTTASMASQPLRGIVKTTDKGSDWGKSANSSSDDGASESSVSSSMEYKVPSDGSESSASSDSPPASSSNKQSSNTEESEIDEVEIVSSDNHDPSESNNEEEENRSIRFGWWQTAESAYERMNKTDSTSSEVSLAPSAQSDVERKVSKSTPHSKAVKCLVKDLHRSLSAKGDSKRGLAILKALEHLVKASGDESNMSKSPKTPAPTMAKQNHAPTKVIAQPEVSKEQRKLNTIDKENSLDGFRSVSASLQHLTALIEPLVVNRILSHKDTTSGHASTSTDEDSLTATSKSQSSVSVDNSWTLRMSELEAESEELRALISAQGSHLDSTLATLEQIASERTDLKSSVESLREDDHRKSEFIVRLNQQVTQQSEEKQGLRVMLKDVETRRQELEAENKDLRQESCSQVPPRPIEPSVDEKNIRDLKDENYRLEQDVIDIINCCKDYRHQVEILRGKTEPMPPQKRALSVNQVVQVRISEGAKIVDWVVNEYIHRGTQVGESSTSILKSEENDQMNCYEMNNLQNRIRSLEDDKKRLKDSLFVAREEKRMIRNEVTQKSQELTDKANQIEQLEFLLKCEVELATRNRERERESANTPNDIRIYDRKEDERIEPQSSRHKVVNYPSPPHHVTFADRHVSSPTERVQRPSAVQRPSMVQRPQVVERLPPLQRPQTVQHPHNRKLSSTTPCCALDRMECKILSRSPSPSSFSSQTEFSSRYPKTSFESVDLSTATGSSQDLFKLTPRHFPPAGADGGSSDFPSVVHHVSSSSSDPRTSDAQPRKIIMRPSTNSLSKVNNEIINGFATPHFGSTSGSREVSHE